MYDRRTVLAATGAMLSSLAGCLSTDAGPETTAPDASTGTDQTDEPTPGMATDEGFDDPPDWENEWYRSWDYSNALGVDPVGGVAYVTASDEHGGPSATVAVDPADGSTLWATEHEGEAVGRSYAMPNEGDDHWGVTVADDAVFSVNGRADQFEWTTLHAMDRGTGERLWHLRRDRLLGVEGVVEGTVFVLATDFFEPEHSHDEPEPRPMTVLAVDADTGEVRWDETVTAAEATAAVDADGVYLVADDRLLAFAHDGTKRGERALATTGARLAVADGGRFLLQRAEAASRVSGIATDGSEQWSHEREVFDHLAVDDVLYVDDPGVGAIGSDGSVRWETDAGGGDFFAGPSRETLYTRSGLRADAVTAHRTSDGTAQWTFDPPHRNAWPAAATSETVVVEALAEHAYRVYAVDAASGDLLARLGNVQSFSIEGMGDRVLVADGAGGVQALPARP
ncbi:PQQ-binding-like beta-propeller repeat protein [Haloarchaeobius sp. HRN-SO-5]|uniref:outer membrane protein assembly factor BamB family protein n=1 Tax=Haloarchaeobius sp. HRN-SO-5 TaxID=3446118 RepID=UPI003EBCE91E